MRPRKLSNLKLCDLLMLGLFLFSCGAFAFVTLRHVTLSTSAATTALDEQVWVNASKRPRCKECVKVLYVSMTCSH